MMKFVHSVCRNTFVKIVSVPVLNGGTLRYVPRSSRLGQKPLIG